MVWMSQKKFLLKTNFTVILHLVSIDNYLVPRTLLATLLKHNYIIKITHEYY